LAGSLHRFWGQAQRPPLHRLEKEIDDDGTLEWRQGNPAPRDSRFAIARSWCDQGTNSG
jgi:hypothetical protein